MNKETKKEEYKTPPHQWTVDFLHEEFKNESDRAAVILVASLIDEALTSLLKNFLVPQPSANDSLFDSATSPLSTFSAKIDMSHRLGLISSKYCRDLHLIRKIRNSFAHDIYGCSFENGSVKSRVDALSQSIVRVEHNENDDSRTRFLWLASIVIWVLNGKVKRVKCLNEYESEWIYFSMEEEKKKVANISSLSLV